MDLYNSMAVVELFRNQWQTSKLLIAKQITNNQQKMGLIAKKIINSQRKLGLIAMSWKKGGGEGMQLFVPTKVRKGLYKL